MKERTSHSRRELPSEPSGRDDFSPQAQTWCPTRTHGATIRSIIDPRSLVPSTIDVRISDSWRVLTTEGAGWARLA